MMNSRYIHWEEKELKRRFINDFPHIYQAALTSKSVSIFKEQIITHYCNDTITRLCKYDGQTIRDFSTEKEIYLSTISLLYTFLRDKKTITETYSDATTIAPEKASIDLLTDLYFICLNAGSEVKKEPAPKTKLAKWAKQWASGLEPAVLQAREASKQRIIKKIVARIDRWQSPHSLYFFPKELHIDEKIRLVEEWWNNYRFHLNMAIKSPEELNFYLDNTLPTATMKILVEAKKKGIPFFITPYYLSLLDITNNTFDDATLRAYILYTKELVDTFGQIKAWEKEDKIAPGKGNAAGWILPEGKNIHRRYPDVAIFIPDSVGRACGGLCASCQRMYGFQSERLNFKLDELLPKESWPLKLKKLMTYFEEDTQLRDILITGGDAFMSRNATLANIFEAIYKMAVRKRQANENRPEGEKYAEIQRIRLGSRLLAYLPMRVDDELVTILKEFRDKAIKVGIKQFLIQTHFQTPLEMTREAKEAIKRISSTGWIITNQLVFNVPASRRGHTAMLRRVMINNGIIPYYTFVVKGFQENYAVYAPIARLMQEKHEEKVYGALNDDQKASFVDIICSNIPYIKKSNDFLHDNNRPFVATDRSVINLPGIGKSMTFQLVGITPQGNRIIRFDHDTTRKHSSVIEKIGAIYITENKSILYFLKQLALLGEDVQAYQSIWGYTEGESEPKFNLYEYPEFQFTQTNQTNHFEI